MKNCEIPTSEISQDIKDTQYEIDDLENELVLLKRKPQQNRTAIYLKEGGILRRKEFIEKLKAIIKYREEEQ